MADGVRVHTELLRDGADSSVFGVEPVTYLYPQLVAKHVYLRKERGNGSTKRPRRPKRAQRSHPLCRGRAPFPLACLFSSRRRHTSFDCDWSSDVCSSD